MKKTLIWAACAAALVAASPALAQTGKTAAAASGFKAPRNAFGQPDFDGTWSNATLTQTARPALYGDRAVHTDQEVKLLEQGAVEYSTAGNANSTAGATGSSDNVGAYDRGWVDGGTHVMRVGGQARTSLLTTPDGQPPVRKGEKPRAKLPNAGSVEAGLQAVKQANSSDKIAAQGDVSIGRIRNGAFDNPEARSLGERCLVSFGRNGGPPMFPNGWYNNNYQIVQSKDAVAIDIEMVHDTRVVPLNTRHRTDGVRPWFGDSIGWYEGDTLVVETINLPERQNYQGSWKDLKVTERFKRVAKDRVLYQITVED
ncbi:MAG: hypothetical protein EON94_15950, partial [Caulobacteraceae bacterium]